MDYILKSILYLIFSNLVKSNGTDVSTRRATIAEGLKVREKEGKSQLLGVVCRANSQQIVISRNKLNINAP